MTTDEREINRRRRILDHADESGNVAKTCQYFGIPRSLFYVWRNAYRQHGDEGLRRRKVHTKRYNKQVPGHHIQMDVKFLIFKDKQGKKLKRYQYTAIDDATRVRALKVYERHTQKNAIDFVDYVIDKFPFRIQQIRTDRGHEFQAQFHWYVEDLGMRHVYIKARTPQLNGKAERSHQTDQEEFYQLLNYKNDVDLKEKFAVWEQFYNFARPHGAHKGRTPYESLRDKLL